MILRGLWLLARGRGAGMAEFGNSSEALLASLAPLIAFPLVGAGITAVNGQPRLAAAGLLARICAVLVLPVLTYEFARLMGRQGVWLRTAAVLSWSFWLIVPLLFVAAVFGAMLNLAGLPMDRAEYAALALIGGYMLWFQWFTVRTGLQVGALAAGGLVVLIGGAVALCTVAPALVGMHV